MISISELPRIISGVAVGSFGILALLFFLLDRSRRAIGLYSAVALALAADVLLPLVSHSAAPIAEESVRRGTQAFWFLLPALVAIFVSQFLDLPHSLLRFVLIGVSSLGAGVALTSPARFGRGVGVAAAFVFFALLGVVLTAQAIRARSMPESVHVFVGTVLLFLSGLADAAVDRSILLGGTLPVPLSAPAFVVFTGLLLSVVVDEERRLFARATNDALTNLLNRGAFMSRAGQEIARAERTGRSLALVMLDVDHFKSFNDRFGHQMGDRVLVEAATAIAETIRGIDLAGRYGGEEFIVLLVEVNETSAMAAVERIREGVAGVRLKVTEKVTISAGVAIHHGLFERARVAELIKRADRALYEAKRTGRNRATLEAERPATSAAEVRYR